jgi:uncharacterized protein
MGAMPSAGISGLSAAELRVLGCLIEKQRTTPDQYPLSLNSLRLACNQSTNREPVVDYDESVIRDALHRLERRGLTRLASGAGSRASKYRHLLAEALPMDGAEQAVMCVLMVRGAQTPGELKQRCERMHAFASLEQVHETLAALERRELAGSLGRRPGQKEERYRELLGHEDETEQDATAGPAAVSFASSVPRPPVGNGAGSLEERVSTLEREVAALRALVASSREDRGSASEAEQPGERSWEPAR